MSEILVPSFYYPGNNVGCLLVHGLTGTPFEMRELGKALNAQGFTVSGPRLAGHATDCWKDLADATWTHWYASLEAAYERLNVECDKVIIVGLSVGGALGLWFTRQRPQAASALVVMATSVSPSLLAILPVFSQSGWLNRPAIKLFKHFIPYLKKEGSAIADPSARDSHITGRYKALAAVDSFFDFTTQLLEIFDQVVTPTLLIYSHKDPTVDPENCRLIFDVISSSEKQVVWLDKSYHIVTRDFEKQMVFDYVTRLAQRVHSGASPLLPLQ
jgi:carboxylesterase